MVCDFEIHITTSDIKEQKIASFESFCEHIRAKPIIIELSEGKYFRQPMISKVVKCADETSLLQEVAALGQAFAAHSYPVVRTKIEVPVWHKPFVTDFYRDQSCTYYEWHGKIKLNDEQAVAQICESHRAKLSRNRLKNEVSTKFVTLREYQDQEVIMNRRVSDLKQDLAARGYPIVKEELEYCIFDSNELLDKGWLV